MFLVLKSSVTKEVSKKYQEIMSQARFSFLKLMVYWQLSNHINPLHLCIQVLQPITGISNFLGIPATISCKVIIDVTL